MKVNYKGTVDPSHYDLVLAESLVNKDGDFYNLTLKQNLDELLAGEQLLWCEYEIDLQKSFDACKLLSFVGWTKTKVIFNQGGPFTSDAILDSLPRNPP